MLKLSVGKGFVGIWFLTAIFWLHTAAISQFQEASTATDKDARGFAAVGAQNGAGLQYTWIDRLRGQYNFAHGHDLSSSTFDHSTVYPKALAVSLRNSLFPHWISKTFISVVRETGQHISKVERMEQSDCYFAAIDAT